MRESWYNLCFQNACRISVPIHENLSKLHGCQLPKKKTTKASGNALLVRLTVFPVMAHKSYNLSCLRCKKHMAATAQVSIKLQYYQKTHFQAYSETGLQLWTWVYQSICCRSIHSSSCDHAQQKDSHWPKVLNILNFRDQWKESWQQFALRVLSVYLKARHHQNAMHLFAMQCILVATQCILFPVLCILVIDFLYILIN